MFKKIVSQLSLSPSAVSQLTFYAKRLKQERITRSFSAVAAVLIVGLQFATILAPPTASNAASPGDIIYGGVVSKDDLLNKYDASAELKALYAEIPTLQPEERGGFGKEINALRQELESLVAAHQEQVAALPPIDVTAPFDINVPADKRPQLLPSQQGSVHPLMREREIMLDIFYRMGFTAVESRELDDDYHMFTALNFPDGHPARDDSQCRRRGRDLRRRQVRAPGEGQGG